MFNYFTPERKFYKIDDISYGKENVPVSCVNSLDNNYPEYVEYSTVRLPQKNVDIPLDEGFLTCCDCDDGCQDKEKCKCLQLTIKSTEANDPDGNSNDNVGYEFRRLKGRVLTGIYECNKFCKCSKTCLNRVAQNPLRIPLQVFKTDCRGWGIRTLVDIPKGGFICLYVGNLYTNEEADKHGQNYGDEYLMELNLIESVEDQKEGYMSDYEEDFEVLSDDQCKPQDSRPGTTFTSKNMPKFSSTRKYFRKGEDFYTMDGKSIGNIGRYLNHSCDPNVFVQLCFVDTHDLRFPWIALFASTFIPSGEELCMDYNYQVDQVPGKIIYCQCKAESCRGRLL